MVLESGQPIASVARDLDLTTSALATGVKQAKIGDGHRTPSSGGNYADTWGRLHRRRLIFG